jgi:hypothetical protein
MGKWIATICLLFKRSANSNLPKVKKCLGRRFSEFHAYLVPLLKPSSASTNQLLRQGVGHGNPGAHSCFPLCAMGSITALPASVCIGKLSFLFVSTGVCRSLDQPRRKLFKGLAEGDCITVRVRAAARQGALLVLIPCPPFSLH